MNFDHRRISLFTAHHWSLLALCLIFCQLGVAVAAARAVQIAPPPPTGLQAAQPQPAPVPTKASGSGTSGSAILHIGAVLLAGCLISAAALRVKYRRFIGLGVFTNWSSALFLLLGALLCSVPRASVNALASLLTPSGASWAADSAGIMLALLFGIKVPAPKTSREGGIVQGLENPGGSNVIFAVVEEGIRDRLLTRMQSVLVEYARVYTWETIETAGQRTIDEEIAVGRLRREDGEAAIKSLEELRSARDQKSAADRKYRALVRLLSCCPISRLRGALAWAQAGQATGAPK